MDNLILFFDGECNLCNKIVQFVIDRDRHKRIKFSSLQSESGTRLLQQHEIPEHYLDSIILIEKNKIYYKSTAALRLCKNLSGLWPLLFGCVIFPKFLRNWVYDYIARNRIKWFGKANSCWVMTDELKDRFL